MKTWRRVRGDQGEDLAEQFLVERGLVLIDRNVATRGGELDLVMRDGQWLVFVEVKARFGLEFGYPEEALTKEKQRHLRSAVFCYLKDHGGFSQPWRLDVVSIVWQVEKETEVTLLTDVWS